MFKRPCLSSGIRAFFSFLSFHLHLSPQLRLRKSYGYSVVCRHFGWVIDRVGGAGDQAASAPSGEVYGRWCECVDFARSAQGNAAEYIPITLILMGFAEFNGANVWWLHATGIAFILGRLLHAKAILNDAMKGRVTGMKLTFGVMVVLMVLNLIYLPYGKLF